MGRAFSFRIDLSLLFSGSGMQLAFVIRWGSGFWDMLGGGLSGILVEKIRDGRFYASEGRRVRALVHDMFEFVEGPEIISILAFCCQVVANAGTVENGGLLRRQLPHRKLEVKGFRELDGGGEPRVFQEGPAGHYLGEPQFCC